MNMFLDLWAQAHIAGALDIEPKEVQPRVVRTLKSDVMVSVSTYKFGLKAEAKISKRVMAGGVTKAVKAYTAAIERIIRKLKAQLAQKALSGELDKPEPPQPMYQNTWPNWAQWPKPQTGTPHDPNQGWNQYWNPNTPATGYGTTPATGYGTVTYQPLPGTALATTGYVGTVTAIPTT